MLARFLLQNPRLLAIVIGIVIVIGLSAFIVLPRMEDPILTQRVGVIRTIFPGADAERVESLVSKPIEIAVGDIEGIKEIFSYSISGTSTVRLELEDHVENVDDKWGQVRDKLEDVVADLPEGAMDPDFTTPNMKAYAAMVAVKWNLPGKPNYAILARFAEDLKDHISLISGTETVDIFGDPGEEIIVEVDPDALNGLSLTVADIAMQVEESDSEMSAGLLRGKENDLIIEPAGELDSLKRLESTPIVLDEQGKLVNLSDIATITKGTTQPPLNQAIIDGKYAVVVCAYLRDEQRIDLWNDDLQDALAEFDAGIPTGIEMDVIFNQNNYVETSLNKLMWNLGVSIGAVVLVVFLMMGWRSMIVVGAALPLSAMLVLGGMRYLGIPIHQMSITGLIIALGLLIDNAIIIVDEVRSRLRTGLGPLQAIEDAVGHLALPLFGSTLTTALAFTPIALLPGSTGEFVGSIAISVILAISASFLLAMTVIPALTVLLPEVKTKRKWFWIYGFGSERLTKAYHWTLVHLYRIPIAGALIGMAIPVFGFLQARNLPEQFFPPTDRDQISVEMELAASTALSETEGMARKVRDSMFENESVARVHWFTGRSAPPFFYNILPRRRNSSFYAHALVELKPDADSQQTIHQLQDRLDDEYPQARILVRQLEQGPPFEAPVEIRLFGPDLAELQRLGSEARLILSDIPDIVHTRSDLEEAVPKISLKINEREARLAGLDHGEIAKQLYTSLEGLDAGTVMEGTEELPVRVRTGDATRANLDAIGSLQLKPLTGRGRADTGPPLSAISDLELQSEVSAMPRLNGRRMNVVQAYITAGTLPVKVMDEFKRRLEDSDFELPPGYSLEYGGENAKRNEAVTNLMADIGLLIALMIATLVASFQSFRVSFLIALVGAMAIGLGLCSLWIFGYPFGFMAILGIMGLVGVAINDTIVVLAGIREEEPARLGDPEAISEVVIHRSRHVFATSLTTIAGFTPLILGGGGFWPPVAIAIAGGVGGATILALYFAPSVYLMMIGKFGWQNNA